MTMHNKGSQLYTFVFAILLILTLSLLGGCQSVETEPGAEVDDSRKTYTGSVESEDINRFKNEVWEKLRGSDRCGSCHIQNGSAPTPFVRNDDVNAAYNAALTIINRETPENSLMVTKVADNHQCWLGASEGSSCAAQLVVYLRNWLYPNSVVRGEEVELTEPTIREPDTSIIPFPTGTAEFETTVWPELVNYCASCHADSATIPQAPFFSQTDIADIQEAFDAAKSKMDLNNPANSRLVVRLREEFHNCWSDCATDADFLESKIQELADLAAGLGGSELDLVTIPNSKALYIHDGTIASGGGRFDDNLIALYKFDDGEGDDLINDASGIGSGADLQLYGTEGIDYRWLGGWGIEFMTLNGRAQATPQASAKLHDMITASGEYTIETWVIPGNVTQGDDMPSAMVSYSAGNNTARNFTLRQRLYNYDYLNRSSVSDANGEPILATEDDNEVAQTTLQHVVATYDPVNGRRLYANGEMVASNSANADANLADWDDSFALMIGNEAAGNQPWNGSMRFLGIHSRALTPEQIAQNHQAGVGERYFLLFNIDEELAKGGLDFSPAYIMLEVAQFDSYSYLFNQPTFISLQEGFTADDLPAIGIPISGLRIGINGKEPEIGQTYLNIDTLINRINYSAQGQVLSDMGTIISLENGAERDEFFLTFDSLNGETDVRVPGTWDQEFPAFSGDAASDIGLRTFDEINATMAALTGVDPTLDAINGDNGTFTLVKQQLPTNVGIDGFVSAHQVGVAQLAIEYCHNLVEDTTLRADFFPGFNFNATASAVSDADWNDLVVTPMVDRFVGSNLSSQPDNTEVSNILNSLITLDDEPIGSPDGTPEGLAKCGSSCATDQTETVVKASCAALLGSAVMLVQ